MFHHEVKEAPGTFKMIMLRAITGLAKRMGKSKEDKKIPINPHTNFKYDSLRDKNFIKSVENEHGYTKENPFYW